MSGCVARCHAPSRLAAALRVLAVVAAVVFAVAGCGRPEQSVVIELWAAGREGEVVSELVRGFESRHPGIRVEVQSLPWSGAHEKLLTAVVGESAPDVAQLGNTWLSNGATDLLLDQFSTQFSWQVTGAPAWQMDLQDTRIRQGNLQLHWPGLTIARNPAQDLGFWIGADYLPLQDALPIARDFMTLLGMTWPAAMPTGIFRSGKQFPTVGGASGPLMMFWPSLRPSGARMNRFSPST